MAGYDGVKQNSSPPHTFLIDEYPDTFLIEEYKGLLELDKVRNERFDRLVTMFLSLAAAPWVLYALVIKDKGSFALSEMPPVIALVLLLVGLLGFLVVTMCVQTKFTITMYMRVVNGIRGRFAYQASPIGSRTGPNVLRLPTQSDVPPYYEKGSYNFYAALGMALVNAGYVLWGSYLLLSPWHALKWFGIPAGLVWLGAHYWYYIRQARHREERGMGELTFRASAVEQKSAAPSN
jgi:hypothetical protein